MPAGRVKRIDEQRKVVYIVRRGRTLAAPLTEVESKARVPNARVEFRLVRHHGDESAADVRLRTGTRTNRRQRRFGDLTGARRPGSKVVTMAAQQYGIDTSSPPFQVVEAWLEAMAERDLDGAMALYRPDATFHAVETDLSGLHRVRAALERSPLAGLDPDEADIYGLGRYVRVDCRCDDDEHGVSFIVERGEIVEQWIDVDPTGETGAAEESPAPPFQLVLRGSVADNSRHYAGQRVEHLLETVGRPVRFVRLKLTAIDNPGNDRPAMAEVVLDLDRTIIRAHHAAATFTEAVDRVIDRLQVRIRQDQGRRRDRRRTPAPINGLGSSRPAAGRNPGSVAVRADRPEIVRHRSFIPDGLTIDEAAWDLDMLDYDFLLFVEADTGDDAMLTRDEDGELIIHFRRTIDSQPADTVCEVSTVDSPPPRLRPTEAVGLLEATGNQFVFFVDESTGRGNVVHRRHDGDYGLITPAQDP